MFLLVEGSSKQWQIPEEAAINPREKCVGEGANAKAKTKRKSSPRIRSLVWQALE